MAFQSTSHANQQTNHSHTHEDWAHKSFAKQEFYELKHLLTRYNIVMEIWVDSHILERPRVTL